MKRFPPILIRDRGWKFAVNNPDDGTPIREMFALGDGLLLIAEKCTYRVKLADQIDPDRRNPALPPNIQQKLFDHGTKSDLLCRTLLHAKVMFRKEFQVIDVDVAKQFAFEALGNLVSMNEIAEDFKSAEEKAVKEAEALERKDASLTIPALGDVRDSCKTFMQKADHFCVSLMSIVRLFYPEPKGMNWSDFHELIKARYGEADRFYKVSELTTPALLLVRNARDCLEHNQNGAEVRDFELQPDGSVAPPTIEIDFRKSVQERCPVSWFMAEATRMLLDTFEMIVVHACSKNIQAFAGIQMVIAPLPDDQRDAWHVRFAYGMYYEGGQFVPCG